MPWWSWILIWVALAAVALLFYVLIGYRLFRQFMAVLKEVEAAGSRLSFTPAAVSAVPGDPGAGLPAIFEDPEAARLRYEGGKAARKEARRERRVERRHLRGQPRAWRDIPGL
ncbi:hypothetical protein [Arthrobacter sp.]|uniref:hypothetical protein n=1 Tax=Arthrobacter sp. TaxID=1667 RepID=UPI00289D4B65|nr:hypothetical protein [Arthrobacter sp.]